MLLRIFVPFIAFLLLNLLQVTLQSISSSFNYDFQPPGFIPLHPSSRVKRVRRQIFTNDEGEDIDMWETPPPANFTVESEDDNISEHCADPSNGSSTCKSEHTYYEMKIYSNNTQKIAESYVNMDEWLKRPEITGAPNHDQLISSYRKAANVKLSFQFPFYGHRLANITIATGGFVYVGDQTHSWLAATQYIAPLMANFDTLSDNSTIKYGFDGVKMIVEWANVRLRDNKEAGPFTFQMQLLKNGDIYFIYKDVPINVSSIKDHNHPCKLGISDAYLFNHKISHSDSKLSAIHVKRVIHEYHRISVPMDRITNNTVVILTALPNCLDFLTCGECSNATLKSFNCSWCQSKENGEKPFCSDDDGLHRRRQEWVEGNCGLKNREVYCDSLSHDGSPSDTSATSTTNPPNNASTTTEPPHPDSVVPLSGDGKKGAVEKPQEETTAGGGLTFLVVFLALVISGTAWVIYAYYNPHTPSGQFLIKYRPSKWQIPSSHVRYSASLHM
uniref:Plexin domain-containing protein 2 n=1 Tax=Acrobeloides nanus TaxID=290746 RepID=A0A914BZJ8_9BILA